MLVLARRDERSREEAEAKALGAKTLGAKALETKAPETKAPKAKALEAKAPKAKALETEALEAKEDEGGAEVGAAKMPRVQKKRRTQAEETSYTVGSLAKLAGVTVRALHHYEDEGLLHPERTASGYRHYGAADVERLQQILLLRSCGLSLGAIRDAFADDRFDFRAVLTDHLATLRARQKELETLMGTVEKTIASLEGRCTMTDKERFEGMKARAIAENEEHYGAEVRRRHGDAAMDAANERMAGMTEAEWNDAKALEAAILDQLAAGEGDGRPDRRGGSGVVRHARSLAANALGRGDLFSSGPCRPGRGLRGRSAFHGLLRRLGRRRCDGLPARRTCGLVRRAITF